MAGKGRAGSPKSGRQKGTPNKSSRALWEALNEWKREHGGPGPAGSPVEGSEEDPHVWLWMVMAGRKQFARHVMTSETHRDGSVTQGYFKVMEPASLEARMQAAYKLLPFLRPTLAQVRLEDDDGKAVAPLMVDMASLVKLIEKGSG